MNWKDETHRLPMLAKWKGEEDGENVHFGEPTLFVLRIFYTWSDTQIFVQKERRTSKWGLALEFQVSGLYPLCGSVPLSGISSHLKMALSSAHRMLLRTAADALEPSFPLGFLLSLSKSLSPTTHQ